MVRFCLHCVLFLEVMSLLTRASDPLYSKSFTLLFIPTLLPVLVNTLSVDVIGGMQYLRSTEGEMF